MIGLKQNKTKQNMISICIIALTRKSGFLSLCFFGIIEAKHH